MIRGLDPEAERYLADLADINRRVEQAQRKITSGRRVNNVSDDPDRISRLVQTRTELGQTEQIRFNLGRVKAEVDAAEQALQAAVRLMDRAAVLGTQGATGTLGAGERRMIAEEVNGLLDQLVGLTRISVEARYIFSGDSDREPPYTLDLALDDPFSDYLGSAATRQVMHPSGTLFTVGRTAEEIFDNPEPERNAFGALNDLRLALLNNDAEAVAAAVERIGSAGVHLNSQLAFYGATQNQVQEAIEFSHRQELRLKAAIAEIQDADLTEAILEMKEASFLQEVALNTKAKAPKRTLFDYLW